MAEYIFTKEQRKGIRGYLVTFGFKELGFVKSLIEAHKMADLHREKNKMR